jgi:hypothetical protein
MDTPLTMLGQEIDTRRVSDSAQRDSGPGEEGDSVGGEELSEAYRDTLPEIPLSKPPPSGEPTSEQRPSWEPVPTRRATAHEVAEGVAPGRSLLL